MSWNDIGMVVIQLTNALLLSIKVTTRRWQVNKWLLSIFIFFKEKKNPKLFTTWKSKIKNSLSWNHNNLYEYNTWDVSLENFFKIEPKV